MLLASATATLTLRANPEPAEMLTPTVTTIAVADGVVGVSASFSAVTSTVPLEIRVEPITSARTCTAVSLTTWAPAPLSVIAALSPTVIPIVTATANPSTPPI